MEPLIDTLSLARDGFVEGSVELPREQLLSFFAMLGRPISGSRHSELIRDIRPQHTSEAPRNTLSSRYGLDSFPFHTDGAHWIRPPRYLVLYCLDPGRAHRQTMILSPLELLSKEEKLALRRELWRVTGIARSFWVRVLDGVCGDEFLRFDEACMRPERPLCVSATIMQRRIGVAAPRAIHWEQSKFLVIDNWRTLHARGTAMQTDHDRHHLRILLQ
jgi:L-asparagine oxygenase